jgi:hypothetical protein
MVPIDSRTAIAGDVRQLIERHHAFYEVSPLCVLLRERTAGAVPTIRRVREGFDIDVYGARTNHECKPTPAYESVCGILEDVAATLMADKEQSCSIQVIPLRSTFLDTRTRAQLLAVIRIRISHRGSLDQPGDAAEQRALLNALENQLQGAGLQRAGGMREPQLQSQPRDRDLQSD